MNAAFSASEDVSYLLTQPELYRTTEEAQMLAAAEKSYQTAGFIALGEAATPYLTYVCSVFCITLTGGLGIILFPAAALLVIASMVPFHRLYLGTGGNGLQVSLLYCVTLAWLGALPAVDAVILLSADHRDFFDNPKYIMWLD